MTEERDLRTRRPRILRDAQDKLCPGTMVKCAWIQQHCHETYQNRAADKLFVFEYIEVFYNRQRLHSSNGYMSPVDYELQYKAA